LTIELTKQLSWNAKRERKKLKLDQAMPALNTFPYLVGGLPRLPGRSLGNPCGISDFESFGNEGELIRDDDAVPNIRLN